MAITVADLPSASGYKVIRDTVANATLAADVSSGPCTLLEIDIDNSANAAQDEHFCMWDAQTATVGTTAPDFIVFVERGARVSYSFPEGAPIFLTALSYACKQEAGTAGTTNPTASVIVNLKLKATA